MSERRERAPHLRVVEDRPWGGSDEQLVSACACGDHAALGELFDRHSEPLYRFLARLSGAPGADLDELVSETFLHVFRGAPQFRGQSAVRTWITGIAVNVARHHTRRETRRRAFLGVWRERLTGTGVAAGGDAVRFVERRDLMRRLGALVAGLPYDLRVVYVMCDVEEMAGVEAARALGVAEGTVWRRLHEARRALRTALEREGRA
jgi:RNA polymerase sigma-70 factor, ECF subfamily